MTNPQFPENLVTFTEEILNGKLHFLCSVYWRHFFQMKCQLLPFCTEASWENSGNRKFRLHEIFRIILNGKQSLLNRVPCVPACYVPACLRAIVVYVSMCLRASMVYVPRYQKRGNFLFLRANMPINVPKCHTVYQCFNLVCQCAKLINYLLWVFRVINKVKN